MELGLAIAFRSYFSNYDCCVGILRQRAQESVCFVLHLEDCEEDVDIFCQQKRKVMLLLGSLPSCPDDLPEEIGKRVTLKGPIVPSKIVGSGFADLANSIPNRESHEAVKQYKLATLYGGKC